jgi:hypothetical protein
MLVVYSNSAEVMSTSGVELDDEKVLQFIERNKAANTIRKIKNDLNIWSRWCETVDEHRKVERIYQLNN